MSCLNSETCAQLDAAYKQFVKASGTGPSSASCSGSTTCTCSASQKGITLIGTGGTFTVQGDDIMFTMSTATSIDSFGPYAYCVQNDLLHLLTTGLTVDSTGNQTVVVYGDIVAQKQ